MTNNEGIIFINCPNCGESLKINSQQAEEICPICKNPLDIQTLAAAESQPTRKDKIKELLGRNLDSYHTKAKQLLTDIEKKNKEQNHKISVLTNKLDNDYLTKTEEGSVISLDYSKEGMVYLDELQGNTMVNYCTDGSKELTLNGDIDVKGTFVTTTEGVDNGLVDVMCEGNTIVNIQTQHVGLITINTTETYYNFLLTKDKQLIKPSTTYTLIVNVIENTLEDNNDLNGIVFGSYSTAVGDNDCFTNIDITPDKKRLIQINGGQKGLFKYTITSLPNLQDAPCILRNFVCDRNESEVHKVSFWYMLLEGDWTNKDIPTEYFEDMKSVGQDNVNGHKIEILSRNKYNWLEGLKIKGIIGENIELSENDMSRISMSTLNCTPNTVYYIKDNNKYYSWIAFSDSSNIILSTLGWEQRDSFTTPSNATKIRIQFAKSPTVGQSNIYASDVQNITIKDLYNNYNKKEILLNEPLRALPNGIKDRFVKIGGKWYVERNCGEAVLDNVVVEAIDTTFIPNVALVNVVIPNMNAPLDSMTTISNIKCILASERSDSNFGAYITLGNKVQFCCPIDVNYAPYINNLNMKLVYPLAIPTYEPLTIEPILTTYADTTHISNNSLIPCNMTVKNSGYNAIIKPSTLYTVALDTNKSGTIGCNLGGAKGITTNNVLTLTTPAILTDDSLRIYGKDVTISKIRLLEGDKTNWVPSHFEGIKSSFEDKFDTTDNTYKMEILSNNKNLFDRDKAYYRAGWGEQNYQKYKNGFSFYSKNGWNSIGYAFESLKNKTVTVCATVTCVNKDTSKQQEQPFSIIPVEYGYPTSVRFRDGETKKVKFNITLKDNGRVYFIGASNNEGSHRGGIQWLLEDISVVEGIENDYVPREYNKIQFSSIEPLRGVDNVKDRFIFKDGKLMIERNCDEVILNGSENWRISPTFTQLVNNHTIYYDFPTADKFNNNNYLNGLCNKFKVVNGSDFVNDAESIVLSTAWWDTTKRCSLRVRRSKLSSTNLDSFKEWLSENPIKVVYDLSEPTYEEIPFELQKIILEGYENGILFFDTNIPPTATITYAGEAPIVSAVKSTRTNVSSNTDDINDNIVPYLMDMDYRVVCLQLAENTESISVARLLGGTYEMLQRDIQSKRYPVDEYKHRLDAYLEVKKITEEEYIKLGEMLNE